MWMNKAPWRTGDAFHVWLGWNWFQLGFPNEASEIGHPAPTGWIPSHPLQALAWGSFHSSTHQLWRHNPFRWLTAYSSARGRRRGSGSVLAELVSSFIRPLIWQALPRCVFWISCGCTSSTKASTCSVSSCLSNSLRLCLWLPGDEGFLFFLI